MSDPTGPAPEAASLRRALAALTDLRARLEAAERARHEPVAIIGLGCRLPGRAVDPDGFWNLLRHGESAVTEIPAERWDVDALYDPDPDAPGRMYTRYGAFIRDIDRFDPRFFEISGREAQSLDPQQRLLLEVSWEALEHAGQSATALRGSDTGVFVGISTDDYSDLLRQRIGAARDLYSGTGSAKSIAAGRLSYFFGFHGPAMALDTACSSSLLSVHLAAQALRTGQCRLALAGGVNAMLSSEPMLVLCRGRMLSHGPRCRTFDAAADGYVRGEGCGMVVLKRLADALEDGDRVLAVLRGSAVNQDGRSSGLTAPNGAAQEALLRAALEDARIAPERVSYIEAHGTGTKLGDPIEMRAIQAVFGDRPQATPLRVGSVKTNIGHLEAAAGVAGLIKVVLSLGHGVIPPHLHLEEPNPAIDWTAAPIEIPREATAWPRDEQPRVAGISAFAFSGTNVHLVVEEAPQASEPAASGRPATLLTLSARSEPVLRRMAADLDRHLAVAPAPLDDVAWTVNAGRARLEHRLAFVTSSIEDARRRLSAFADGDEQIVQRGTLGSGSPPKIAFLYTGQGAQFAGMGRQLYESQAIFRAAIDECEARLGDIAGRGLTSLLFDDGPDADARLQNTGFAQPALFAIEYALTQLWRAWGIEPAAVIGHSVGEFAAACAAGVLSLQDGLTLIAARARLMQTLPSGGGMLAIAAPAAKVDAVLAACGADAWVAAINAPDETVVAGATSALRGVEDACRQSGITFSALRVSHAFHTPLMAPMIDAFRAIARTVTPQAPMVRLVSNVTAQPLAPGERMDAEYWCRHVLAPVRFGPSLEALHAAGYDVFVEIGPHPVLTTLGRRSIASDRCAWIASLRKGRPDWVQIQEAVGALFVRGRDFDARALAAPTRHRLVALPGYPFERRRVWMDTDAEARPAEMRTTGPGRPADDAAGAGSSLVRSAANGDWLLESIVRPTVDAVVRDHVVFGTRIYPAMGFVSHMCSALAQVHPGRAIEIRDFAVSHPLVLGDDCARRLQTVVQDDEAGGQSCTVFSAERDADPSRHAWLAHASATARPIDGLVFDDPAPTSGPGRAEDARAFYGELGRRGVQHGPFYRLLAMLEASGGQARGRIAPPPDDAVAFHTGRMDAALQVLGAALSSLDDEPGDALFLPVRISRLTIDPGAGSGAWTVVGQAVATSEEADTRGGDLWCYDEQGRPVLAVEGFVARRATPAQLRRLIPGQTEGWLHELAWKPADAPEAAAPGQGTWIVLADRSGIGEALAGRLRAANVAALVVDPDDVAPMTIDSVAAMVRRVAGANGGRLYGIVHLWSLDDTAERVGSGEVSPGLTSAIGVVQAIASAGETARLVVATSGAQAAGPVVWPLAPSQSGIWGFGRVVSNEEPGLGLRLVDLDPGASADDASAMLFAELLASDEPQVAYRQGQRLAPRLVRGGAPGGMVVPSEPYALTIEPRGILDHLRLTPALMPSPRPGEVQVRLTVSALNFRDVLNALGMYPGGGFALGSESVGEVVGVGAGVTDLAVGDRVMGIAGQAFTSSICTRAALLQRVPPGMTDEAAATIPTAYMTAWYALVTIARLRPGERVLVHAAAGGVGLAAVHVAKRLGAEIFATAGSDAKRAYLRGLGVRHVFDSRSASFERDIGEATGGTGIDAVLNSLTGELIPASLRLLRDGGRFVEIGKTDLWTPERVANVRPGVTYTIFDLGQAAVDHPEEVRSVFSSITAEVASGALPPLPRQTFALSHVRDAFRLMAQARHIGKIVVRHPGGTPVVRADGRYLVTGGLGGLGLVMTRWLVSRGARHVVVVGRSAPSVEAVKALDELAADGAAIHVVRADIGSAEGIAAAWSAGPAELPWRGIIHAAGVLDDGPIRQVTAGRLSRVLWPKVRAAWQLHSLSVGQPLDFFVLFSSIASVFGSKGQASYASANAYLDGLAQARLAQGLPALSINWGPWGEVGMAARLGERERDRWASQGLGLIDPVRGIAAFEAALRQIGAQSVVLPVDWGAFGRQFAAEQVPPLLREVVTAPTAHVRREARPAIADLQARLASASLDERKDIVRAHVREQVARVLGTGVDDVGDRQPLTELGMDSLMAVELSNRLTASTGQRLSPTLAFDCPTVDAIAAALTADAGAGSGGGGAAAADRERATPDALLARLPSMSEEEMDALLQQMLPGADDPRRRG